MIEKIIETIIELVLVVASGASALAATPSPTPTPTVAPTPRVTQSAPVVERQSGKFIYDPEVSWYGPGFYGKRTACGLAYTKTIKGVAHRSLPCGTMVTFRNPDNGRTFTVPVIDRGPYVNGRKWDLSGGLCVALDHCYTGPIEYRIGE